MGKKATEDSEDLEDLEDIDESEATEALEDIDESEATEALEASEATEACFKRFKKCAASDPALPQELVEYVKVQRNNNKNVDRENVQAKIDRILYQLQGQSASTTSDEKEAIADLVRLAKDDELRKYQYWYLMFQKLQKGIIAAIVKRKAKRVLSEQRAEQEQLDVLRRTKPLREGQRPRAGSPTRARR